MLLSPRLDVARGCHATAALADVDDDVVVGLEEPDFLARRMLVALRATPAAAGSLEGIVIFVSKEHGRLVAPVASDHVRISDGRV